MSRAEEVVATINRYRKWAAEDRENGDKAGNELWLSRAYGMEEALNIMGFGTGINLGTGEIYLKEEERCQKD